MVILLLAATGQHCVAASVSKSALKEIRFVLDIGRVGIIRLHEVAADPFTFAVVALQVISNPFKRLVPMAKLGSIFQRLDPKTVRLFSTQHYMVVLVRGLKSETHSQQSSA